jgi:two-component system, chemotaxis family, sensor kinase CheA
VTENELAFLRDDPEMADLFLAESLDHLGTIEAALLALDERPGDTTLLNDIFRPFHTIKGNAGALGVTSVQEVAHRVENLLDLARSGRRKMGPADVDVVLRAVDVLSSMIRDVGARLKGQPPTDVGPAAQALIEAVDSCIARSSRSRRTRAKAGTPARDNEVQENVEARREASAPSLAVARSGEAESDTVATPSTARSGDPTASIKVDMRKLDSLVDAVGELIIVQSLIQEDPVLAAHLDSRLGANLAQLKRITAGLQRSAMALRMVPIRQAFQKVSRIVRDLSRKADKSVELVLSGEDTELDRKVVEEIADPLMHMVRNSLDHGIELPEVRAASGKRPQARIALSAFHQGGHIVIEIADDGKGLDTEKIKAKAIERGLIAPGATPSVEEIHMMIFTAGFSTAEKVTEISGRGVGMDVVRRNIDALRGSISIVSEPGKGATFQIKMPLTLAVLDGLIVGVGKERFVMPTTAVRESLRPLPSQVHKVQDQPRLVQVRDSLVPLVALGDMFRLPHQSDPSQATVIVIEDEGARVGLVVDALLGKQEVVIKSLGDTFGSVRGVAGGAILGDGRIGLILDAHGIVALTRGAERHAA